MTLPSWGLALFNGSRILLPLFDEVFGIRGEWCPEDGDGHVWLSFSSSAPSLPRLARLDCDSLFGSREKPATFQIGLDTSICHGHYWNTEIVNFFKPQSPQHFGCQILFSVQVDYGRRTTYCGVSIWITISNGNIKACSLLSMSSIQTLKYYDWSRNLQEAGWGVGVRQRLDWYSQDRETWHTLVNAIINLQVP